MDKQTIGKRIRRQREKMALTRDVFSEQVGISPQFLSEIENGTKGMSAETIAKICEKADISADYILLGRQTAGETMTPAVTLLLSIPPRYTDQLEGMLRAFSDAIRLAETGDDSAR